MKSLVETNSIFGNCPEMFKRRVNRWKNRNKFYDEEFLIVDDKDGKIILSAKPELNPGIDRFYLYACKDNINTLLSNQLYAFEVDDNDEVTGVVQIDNAKEGDVFFVTYTYTIDATTVTKIKQIHNNIFCAMDIYIDAVDLKNDDKHTVYIHCDKVQVDTDMVLSINDSSKASFTPIRIKSIADGSELNKDIATVVVI